MNKLQSFLDTLGFDEEPMGMFYTDKKPLERFSPDVSDLPTREKEKSNKINWQEVFGSFSCVIGKIWLARKFFKPDGRKTDMKFARKNS